MKTTFTLALALTIQVNVTAQSPANHMIRMELSQKNMEDTPLQALTGEKLLSEEQRLKSEISSTQKKLIDQQIAVSRIRSYMAYEVFASNNLMISELVSNPSLKTATIEKSQGLNSLAAQDIKLAREIREEANAQATPEAQLAELSNAEEKEALALARQQEAIRLLKLGAPLFIKQSQAEFVSKTHAPQSLSNEAFSGNGLNTLVQQANQIKTTCEQLRAGAAGKTGNEKAAMLDEALSMEQDYTAMRIRISIWQYRITEKTYQENKAFIALLIEGIGNEALTAKAEALSAEADYNFRLGREMREEANAQFTEAARFGELSNAEEKEALALNQQQQGMNELKKLNRNFLLASR